MQRLAFTVLLALALAMTTGVAYAQHEGEGVTEGFHQPPGINLAHYPPPMETVQHEGHAVQQPGPPPFIGPLVNFGLLVLIGYMALKRTINPALNARRASMEAEIAAAKKLHVDAEAMHREVAQRLAHVDTEIGVLRAEFVRAGEAERDRIVAEARERAERMRTEGAQVIAQEIAVMREEIKREVVLAAVAAAEESVRKTITPADLERLTEAYLTEILASAPRARA